jgi:hypothetical protein
MNGREPHNQALPADDECQIVSQTEIISAGHEDTS